MTCRAVLTVNTVTTFGLAVLLQNGLVPSAEPESSRKRCSELWHTGSLQVSCRRLSLLHDLELWVCGTRAKLSRSIRLWCSAEGLDSPSSRGRAQWTPSAPCRVQRFTRKELTDAYIERHSISRIHQRIDTTVIHKDSTV